MRERFRKVYCRNYGKSVDFCSLVFGDVLSFIAQELNLED